MKYWEIMHGPLQKKPQLSKKLENKFGVRIKQKHFSLEGEVWYTKMASLSSIV